MNGRGLCQVHVDVTCVVSVVETVSTYRVPEYLSAERCTKNQFHFKHYILITNYAGLSSRAV
jgi:hypothetical protein